MPVKSVMMPSVGKVQVSKQQQVKQQTKPCVKQHVYSEYVGNPITGAYPKLLKMSPEQMFDFKLHTGTKMKNGSTLIRPVILSLGEVIIKPTDNDKYEITSPIAEKSLTMSEDELKETKWLSRGTIKQMEDDKYILDYTDKDGKAHFVEATKAEAIQILNDNIYYM